MSAFSESQVPLANDPPNSAEITSGYFSISFFTKSKAKFAMLVFSFSFRFVGVIFLRMFEIICFILDQ